MNMKLNRLTVSIMAACVSCALASGSAYAHSRDANMMSRSGTHNPASNSAEVKYAAGKQQEQTTNNSTSPKSHKKSGSTHVEELNQVVVTGNTGEGAVTQKEASYAITTIGGTQLRDLNVHSLTSILRDVPGFNVADTGGTEGNNVYVAGLPSKSDQPLLATEVDGHALYPLPKVSWSAAMDLFRIDDSIERVEVVRGGPSALFTTGNPGAVINFITKDGTETPEGQGTVRLTTGGPKEFNRVDLFWGGQIADHWYATVGGFGRQGDGVHDTTFPVDQGGQTEASLTRILPHQSKLTFRVRHTLDKGVHAESLPVVYENGKIKQYPGFDARKDLFVGRDTHFVRIPRADSEDEVANLARGRGVNATDYSSNLDLNFDGGWTVKNVFDYGHYVIPVSEFRGTAILPTTMSDFINNQIVVANSDPSVVAAAGALATSGTATYINGGEPVGPNQVVIREGLVNINVHLRTLSDELRLTKKLGGGNTLTAGVYFANFGFGIQENAGNVMLMTAQNNARLIGLQLDNGVQVTSPQGFLSLQASTQNFSNWSGHLLAPYLVDNEDFGPWRISAGIRLQREYINGYSTPFNKGVDIDSNALTLFNNGAIVLDHSVPKVHVEHTQKKPSWSFGVTRKLTSHTSIFFRASSQYIFTGFAEAGGVGEENPLSEVEQYFLGVKSATRLYSASIVASSAKFDQIDFNENISNPDGSFSHFNVQGSTESQVVAAQISITPTPNFSLQLSGTYIHSKLSNFGVYDGNRIPLQPKIHYRVKPTYFVPTRWGALRFYASYSYLSDIYQSYANMNRIPGYHFVDLGAQALVGDHWDIRFGVNNVGNVFGLTEGNTSVIGVPVTNGPLFARPIYGRTWRLSTMYTF